MAYAQGDAPSLPPPQSMTADSNSTQKAREADAGAREVRSGALRLLAAVLARFPAACDYGPYWPRFFAAIAPLLPRLLIEVRPLSNRDLQPGWFRMSMLLLQPVLAALLRCDCPAVTAAACGVVPLHLSIPSFFFFLLTVHTFISHPLSTLFLHLSCYLTLCCPASLLLLPRCYLGCLWRCAVSLWASSADHFCDEM